MLSLYYKSFFNFNSIYYINEILINVQNQEEKNIIINHLTNWEFILLYNYLTENNIQHDIVKTFFVTLYKEMSLDLKNHEAKKEYQVERWRSYIKEILPNHLSFVQNTIPNYAEISAILKKYFNYTQQDVKNLEWEAGKKVIKADWSKKSDLYFTLSTPYAH